VGKSRLPWTAAGDGVGRATAFGGGRRAPGRGRRSWAWGAAWDRRPWAGAVAVGSGAAAVGTGRGRGRRDGGGAAASERRWGGDVGPAACGRARAARRRGARARRRASVVKETERKKKGPPQWLFRITPVGLAARPTGVI
jgi:hypothetical protein